MADSLASLGGMTVCSRTDRRPLLANAGLVAELSIPIEKLILLRGHLLKYSREFCNVPAHKRGTGEVHGY